MARGLLNHVKQKNPIFFTRKTFIIGADDEGLRIAESLLKRFDTGLELIGIIDTKLPEQDNKLPIDFIGQLSDLRDLVVKYRIRELIFSTSAFTNKEILNLMNQTKDLRLTYRMIPRQQEILLGKASIEDIGDLSFLNIEYSLFYSLHRLTKRVFDLTISLLTLIIFSPIILLLLLLKKVRKKQYWGLEGKKFDVTIFNVRSRFIRELPLFIAVLLGDLSLVGSTMFETTEPNPNLICQPGLTGLERIRSIKFNPEDRLALDHYYVQNQSFTMDLEIIMKTVFSN